MTAALNKTFEASLCHSVGAELSDAASALKPSPPVLHTVPPHRAVHDVRAVRDK